jgi:curli production assembly/transport component CsgG
MKKLLAVFMLFMLVGCATTSKFSSPEKPTQVKNLMQKEFDTIPPPAGKPVVVAVYSFLDKTGQRRPAATIANLSTAVTQGADAFLIKALGDVGRGTWFTVVERVGIDSLTKERQLIRQMREAYDGANAKPLSPMMFAGVIIEGGITGYDSQH